ncbi:hypothetical protein HAX54_009102 [Datura stramonium]|uniref:Bifunctional inhibitor/plant lipid transfer protein/seed storage helical domain-containing protein n=1 Tax=Datura stramonium TaxID=4076 RepID=A0ABS8RZF1_DATST|nr:hypothetical protein [Datura stramonium]
MGKNISVAAAAALVLCLLAVASANTFTVTVTEEEDNPQRCQEQIQLNHCRMYLSGRRQYYGDELSMVTDEDEINQGQEHLQQCCQELRNIDTQCRCPALKRLVTQARGSAQSQEAERMLGRARYLPRMCNIQPIQCRF